MQSWTLTRLLGALTWEPAGSRESSTAAHTNCSLQEKQMNSKIAFTCATVPKLALIISFLSLFLWGKREREWKLIYFKSVERKQAWRQDTGLSRTGTNFCWRSSPPRWPSELCWGAWKGCSAYLSAAEPRCAGHTAACCRAGATSVFSSETGRSNKLTQTRINQQAAQH